MPKSVLWLNLPIHRKCKLLKNSVQLIFKYIYYKPCIPSPCSINGVCQRSQTNLLSYQCICNPGYSGTYCEIKINLCTSNPCKYGACVPSILAYACV